MRTVLITGVTGSGGSYLAEHVAREHPDVSLHGVARWHSTTSHENLAALGDRIRLHECDLTDFSSVLRVLDAVQPDAVFHLASHANVRASFDTPLAVLRNNIMGTANLLEALRRFGRTTVLLHCSTSEVYGQVEPADVPIREDCRLRAASPYAVSKVAQDALCHCYGVSYGLKIVRTRMFAYINPRRADLFATSFALQIARIEAGLQDVLLHGNLDSTRTMIDVRDAMEAYWMALVKGKPGEVYNIGGTAVITVGAFLETLKGLAQCPIESRVDSARLRPSDVTLQIPDTTKFQDATGWQPRIPFEESLAFLLEHCRGVVRKSARTAALGMAANDSAT